MVTDIVQSWVAASRDIEAEYYILIAIFVVLAVPQIISYLISGIFGCASRPLFISQITKFIMWSLIKAFAVISGISAANAIFDILGVFPGRTQDEFDHEMQALITIASAFFYMMIYYRSKNVLGYIANHPRFRFAKSVHEFLTRYREKSTD